MSPEKTGSRNGVSRLAVGAGIVGFVLVLASCGAKSTAATSSSGGTMAAAATSQTGSAMDNMKYVKDQIQKFSSIPAFSPPGPSFDVKSLAGKTIFNVPQTETIPFLAITIKSMANIAGQIGVKFVDYPTTGQPSQWVQGISQAIEQKANVLSLNVVDPREVGPQIDQARKAGIPAVSQQFYDVTQASEVPANVAADRADQFTEAAKLEADWVISDTNGSADAVVVYNQEVLSSVAMVTALKSEFGTYCSACKVTYLNIPSTDWATKVQPEVAAALVQDPGVNYIIPIYDALAQFVVPAITVANKVGKVHVATFNGSPFALKMIQDADVVRMDVGEDLEWLAYANMDELLRVMAGKPPLADEHTALRIFTKANVGETGSPPTYNSGFGTAYVDGYHKLWGL